MLDLYPIISGLNLFRQQFIGEHVTDFANEPYNPDPKDHKAVVAIDLLTPTYRKVHKHHHLSKSLIIVAPDGIILAILGLLAL